MQFGYVLCDPKRSKILVLTKQGDVEYTTPDNKENVNKALKILGEDAQIIGRIENGTGVEHSAIV